LDAEPDELAEARWQSLLSGIPASSHIVYHDERHVRYFYSWQLKPITVPPVEMTSVEEYICAVDEKAERVVSVRTLDQSEIIALREGFHLMKSGSWGDCVNFGCL